jgi:2-keto-3-deoxy-L-rhamnonate aldolase RhmA
LEPGSVNLKEKLARGDLIVGTWVKTPEPSVVEVLAMTELDCLALDAEHAPFDRRDIDASLLAGRSAGKPVLVRIPANRPEHALQALDCGAAGVVVPHVRSAAEASAAVRMCHYGAGGRGYAGSSRAAGYTRTPMSSHLNESAANTICILQIEDIEAVEQIEEIAAVEGVDALFVGRIDLAVAMGKVPDDPAVVQAVAQVCAAARRHQRRVGMFLSRVEDVRSWREQGATLFLLGSDQSFLLSGAAQLVDAARR